MPASPRPDVLPRVLVAGGGVAALEAVLAMRARLTAEELAITLLTAAERFEYRPLAVLEATSGEPTWGMSLERFCADQDAELVAGELAAVDADGHTASTRDGRTLAYDLLLVAVGARATEGVPGALTFRGPADAAALRRVLADAGTSRGAWSIAFTLPQGSFWSVPAYELALLAAAHLRTQARAAHLFLVTPESEPLELFGAPGADLATALLESHGIELVTDAAPLDAGDGELVLADGRVLAVERTVAMPRLVGPGIEGLPVDDDGFILVDDHGAVDGLDGVFAAGDATSQPFKQGGLATQQADAAAEAILADLGLPIVPRPFAPVLQGVLYSGGEPTYLQAPARGRAPAPRAFSLWWPPTKISGRFLSAYLVVEAHAPRAPEVRPGADALPVTIDVGEEAMRARRAGASGAPLGADSPPAPARR